MFDTFWNNFTKNLFKPLLLFFYLGFAISMLRVPFEFPQALYQGLTIYLLLAIGWHGGEELAMLSGNSLTQAMEFIAVGFFTNLTIGAIAYYILRKLIPKLRRVDAATVAAYYGSDSAGTFVTCLGVLQMGAIAFAAYMPVMLAVMEMPGCLLGLYLISRLRSKGMDCDGNMPNEPEYHCDDAVSHAPGPAADFLVDEKVEAEKVLTTDELHPTTTVDMQTATGSIKQLTLPLPVKHKILDPHLIREIFLNPGIFLLMGGIVIGYVSRLQGTSVTAPDDQLFVGLFQGMLCLFLLEMGMTAAKRIRDLRSVGKRFVIFALVAPNIFACIGITVASLFSHITGQPLELGTYVLFAVLCAAASYIAVPAIQRIAIPEASPTLPLAASLGVTFTYNVTVGIPLYLAIAECVLKTFPVS
ncbi:MAG: sodium-dependent bicarbonate transport family permease [Candidatus Melainabacteria bacterium]|nr:sodium-dependent bicarbonate transport family permease [Candidatus Melainabacteria bacterium]